MSRADTGDTVKVHYIGKLEDGTEFDNTYGKEPLEFILGGGMSIRGFEMGIVGMVVGEIREFEISPELGFGVKKDEYIEKVKKKDLPPDIKLEIGKHLQVPHVDGSAMPATIIDIDNEHVTLDLNHLCSVRRLLLKSSCLKLSAGTLHSTVDFKI